MKMLTLRCKKILDDSGRNEMEKLTDILNLVGGPEFYNKLKDLMKYCDVHKTLGVEESSIKEIKAGFEKISPKLTEMLELADEISYLVKTTKMSVYQNYRHERYNLSPTPREINITKSLEDNERVSKCSNLSYSKIGHLGESSLFMESGTDIKIDDKFG